MILNSPYISGSLTVTGNTNLIGALTVTGSLAGTATSSSFAYTASSAVSAYTAASAVNATTALTASYATSFTVGGTLTAQTLVVQTITSSVSFITGSTRFGSLLTNTHEFTGSMFVTGSTAFFAGNVGIGTASPGTKLDVRTDNGVLIKGATSNNDAILSFLPTTGGRQYDFRNFGSSFAILDSSANITRLYFNFSGNTGIGLTDPSALLHISGSGSGSLMRISSHVSSSIFFVSGSGNIGIGNTNPRANLHIGPSLNTMPASTSIAVAGDTSIRFMAGSDGNADYGSFIAGTQSGGVRALSLGYRQGAGDIVTMTITQLSSGATTGSVGIGTTSPDGVLSVQKDTNGDTPIYFTNASGGSGNTNASITLDFRLRNGSGGSTGGVRLKVGKETDHIGTNVNDYFAISTSANDAMAERMRISAAGYLKLKTVSSVYTTTTHRLDDYQLAQGSTVLVSGNASAADSIILYSVDSAGANAAATALGVGKNSSTSRSINAGGSINASGADYAEYMVKAITDNITKGDIVGVNSEGKLTNIFNDAISFAVKSTDPAYVGNDTWGNIGSLNKPISLYTEEELQQYKATNEAIRTTVDRIAFSGQVPCNVTGATVGDYIIPIRLENGKIGGQAIANPTFEQYQTSVGKVWKIMEDGRAWIAVKIG